MAAPSTEVLFDFETNLETAAKSFLSTATGLPESDIFTTLDQGFYSVPRLEVIAEINEGLDPPIARSLVLDTLDYLNYRATLSIRVVTDALEGGSQTSHRSLRAKARVEMLQNSNNWTTTPELLPYYSIQYQRPIGTSYEVDGELAISTLSYDLAFVIRNDAWPS
jgi:hypothetical protein